MNPDQREGAWSILKKIYHLIFNYDMKMAYLCTWMGESLSKVEATDEIIKKIT